MSLAEFKRRQALHRQAEINAMRDVPEFIHKVEAIYGYRNFVNDAGGSVCELDDPETLRILAEHTLILYICTTPELEQLLIERARKDPKPLYYREAFLDQQLSLFMAEKGYREVEDIPRTSSWPGFSPSSSMPACPVTRPSPTSTATPSTPAKRPRSRRGRFSPPGRGCLGALSHR